jgi:hypothetical protein
MSIGLDESRRAATHPVIAAKSDYGQLQVGLMALGCTVMSTVTAHAWERLRVSIAFKEDRPLSRRLLKRTGTHAIALR